MSRLQHQGRQQSPRLLRGGVAVPLALARIKYWLGKGCLKSSRTAVAVVVLRVVVLLRSLMQNPRYTVFAANQMMENGWWLVLHATSGSTDVVLGLLKQKNNVR
jgi:hypothetical protein